MSACAVQVYRILDELSRVLICVLVVFTPWAFGTTQPWSIWTANIAGYVLGLLLVGKFIIRRCQHYHPPRWDGDRRGTSSTPNLLLSRRLTVALAALTVVILGYCLLSAVNERATFNDRSLAFEYRDCVRWLPHSLDAGGTWSAFWSYLALACSFWAVRDWLLGMWDDEWRAQSPRNLSAKSPRCAGEEAEPCRKNRSGHEHTIGRIPSRLRRLLWLLAINGMLLGLEGIAQRAVGSSKLLFVVKPRIHQTAESQFGPYAYRSNAAQYFNLIWPLCVGFWLNLNRTSNQKRKAHHFLLVSAAVMAACPLVSTSRGGALVMLTMLAMLTVFFLFHRLYESIGDCRRGGKETPNPCTSGSGPVTTRAQESGRGLPHSKTQAPSAARPAPEGFGVRQSPAAFGAYSRYETLGLGIFVIAALGLGLALGWEPLRTRMASFDKGLAGREDLYSAVRPMSADYPWFGTGPGTFETVSQLYLPPDAYRRPQLHNDWLETRITFGCCGSAVLALAFAVVLTRWFAGGGIHASREFVLLTWLALAGCLAHARFDFPFQVHSILLLVIVVCAVLFCVSRRV